MGLMIRFLMIFLQEQNHPFHINSTRLIQSNYFKLSFSSNETNMPYPKVTCRWDQGEISLNSGYRVIFKNSRDKTQFTNLAKQFMLKKYEFLLWAFKDATKLPRSYLLLDMRPETDDKLWVFARIFNDVSYP